MSIHRRRLTFTAVPAMLLAILPHEALAHAILIESVPEAGATVAPGHVAFRLRYNSRIDRARSRLTLLRQGQGPDQSPAVLPIGDGRSPAVMVTQADLAPGDYVLHWQVLAVDGHITRGDVPFSVGAGS
jgi:methionine-rich copper-binding protein CopC